MVENFTSFGAGEITQKDFCRKLRISDEVWSAAKISWDELASIGNDHISQFSRLTDSAALYSNIIQTIEGVHSVRWRVKDPEHLLAKIIRKRAQVDGVGTSKYDDISEINYFEKISDLVGIRALHLFKDDFTTIHAKLANEELFENSEAPFANIRIGDDSSVVEQYDALGLAHRVHPEGYRSIHYVKKAKPFNRNVLFEVQVRTVFEEGWSEVDHYVRYPNHSDNFLIKFNSSVLNRMAGSADEMAISLKVLSKYLEETTAAIDDARRKESQALAEVEKLVASLEAAESSNQNNANLVAKLKSEVSSLRALTVDYSANGLTSGFGLTGPNTRHYGGLETLAERIARNGGYAGSLRSPGLAEESLKGFSQQIDKFQPLNADVGLSKKDSQK